MADGNKTEEATPHRREKAREKGQVARSRELPNVLALAGVAGAIMLMAPAAVPHWTMLYRETLDAAATTNIDANSPVLFWSAFETIRWVAPILIAGFFVSLFAGFMQGGLNIAPEALAFKFDHFNPASRLGQIFSPMGLSSLLKSLLPFGAILWIVIGVTESHWNLIVTASDLGMYNFTGFVGSMVFEIAWKSGLVLLAWSGVDYALTMIKMSSDLKMTKQEVREESKDMDGNPVIKRRIRQLQRVMRRKQSLKAAATATVVITNPTHFAVALRYEADMAAPIVVAKGRIMLIENRPLAQALYKTVEVGDSIPAKLYQAVAEILVIVFRAQADVRRGEAERRSRNASGQSTSTRTEATASGRGGAR
jgi:flagellar biosynthetic protein FlhB